MAPPYYAGVMPGADEDDDQLPRDDHYNVMRRDIPQDQMPEADNAPAPGPAAVRWATQGGYGVPPLVRTDDGLFLADEQGQPLMAGGQPIDFGRWAGAAGYAAHAGMTPEQQAAAAGSSQRWAPTDPAQWARQKVGLLGGGYGGYAAPGANDFAGTIAQRAQYLQGLQQRVLADQSLTPAARAQALNHLYQQQGQLAEHWQRAQQQAQAQAANAAGLPANYGTPGGPELDPRSRQELQNNEYAIQQLRNDPSLSTEQKAQAVLGLRRKIESIDPAGRYRNGQQPMSPIQRAVAQQIHEDDETGVVYSLNPKTGEVRPYFPRQQAQGRAAKQEPGSWDELPFEKKDQLVSKEMAAYGVDAQTAVRQIQARHAAILGGQGAPPASPAEQQQALGVVGRYLGGDTSVSVDTARAAFQRTHPDTRWIAGDAAQDVDQQMQRFEGQRQAAVANGMAYSMPDRATVAARQQRAQALLGGAGGLAPGMVAPPPLKTVAQRQKEEAAARQKMLDDAKAAQAQQKQNAYTPPDFLHLRQQALHELQAERGKGDALNPPAPVTQDDINARVKQLSDAHRAAHVQAHPAATARQVADFLTPLAFPRESFQQPQAAPPDATPAPTSPPPAFIPSGHPLDELIQQGRGATPDSQRARVGTSAAILKGVLADHGADFRKYPDDVKRRYVRNLQVLRQADPSIVIPPELEGVYGR